MNMVARLRTGRALLFTCLSVLLLSSFLLISEISIAWRLNLSDPKYRLQKRTNATGQEDRQEGIEPVSIAGERLELIGAFFDVPALQMGAASATYRLGFYLKEAENQVDIEVRDYEVFRRMNFIYWMLPLQTQYTRGFHHFAWEAALARELGIGVQDLGAIARIRNLGRPMVAPLLLHTNTFPAQMQVQGCRFLFMPNTTMTVEYRIHPRDQETRLVKQGSALQWHRHRLALVVWDGKDRQGRPMPEGEYVLKITATYIPVPGSPEEPLPVDVAFYYTPVIDARALQP
jgi:hypothetical protein